MVTNSSDTDLDTSNAIHLHGLIVVMGVSGCGKSSVAMNLANLTSAGYLEADDHHPAENIQKMSEGTPLTDSDREPWLDIVCIEAQTLLQSNQCVVVACSSLKNVYREKLRTAANSVQFVFLAGSRELIHSRMKERTKHFMPTSLLDSQFATLENPADEPGVVTVDINQDIDQIAREALERLLKGDASETS